MREQLAADEEAMENAIARVIDHVHGYYYADTKPPYELFFQPMDQEHIAIWQVLKDPQVTTPPSPHPPMRAHLRLCCSASGWLRARRRARSRASRCSRWSGRRRINIHHRGYWTPRITASFDQ